MLLRRFILSAAVLSAAVGCAPAAPEPVRLDVTGVEPGPSMADLAEALAGCVCPDGRVDSERLARQAGALERQVKRLAVTGPSATPQWYETDASRWAYWYNARAAWSMYLAATVCRASVAHTGKACPDDFAARPFPLDGRTMSLDAIDAHLLAEAGRVGDFRLAAGTPGVLLDDAPMPAKPFEADGFCDQLDDRLNQLVLDGRRLVIEVENKTVRVPRMLWACRDRVVADFNRRYGAAETGFVTALRAHVNDRARRRLDDALGYTAVGARAPTAVAFPKRAIFFPGQVGRVEMD